MSGRCLPSVNRQVTSYWLPGHQRWGWVTWSQLLLNSSQSKYLPFLTRPQSTRSPLGNGLSSTVYLGVLVSQTGLWSFQVFNSKSIRKGHGTFSALCSCPTTFSCWCNTAWGLPSRRSSLPISQWWTSLVMQPITVVIFWLLASKQCHGLIINAKYLGVYRW